MIVDADALNLLAKDHCKKDNWMLTPHPGEAARLLNETVAEVSWKFNNSILDTLKPKYQFLHDVFDMNYRNHHNIKNAYFRYKMFIDGTESVREEVELTSGVMLDMVRDFSEIVVTMSAF